jgi:riboflavin synthase
MFTGLIEAVGELVERKPTSAGFRLRIGSPLAGELKPGDSIAVSGVCLTVILAEAGEIHADVGPETVRVTTLGTLARGSIVNLERPLRADGRLGGHFVQGHVDAIAHIEDLRADAEFSWLTVRFPLDLAPFIVHKGSIAVDGVSLTVAGLGADRFDVQLVPFTIENTSFKHAQIRDRVNLECDIVGKYVARAAQLAGLTLGSAPPDTVRH